jgi:hypothetical protein
MKTWCISVTGRILLISGLLAITTAFVTNALSQVAEKGEPFSCNGAAGCTTSTFAVPAGLYLDASQFTASDMCAQINAAIVQGASSSSPATIYTIDARHFTGVQGCASNPFAGENVPVRLLLGNVFIVTSAPWFTPRIPHAISGIVSGEPDLSPFAGTIIAACGPGLNGVAGITYATVTSPHKCTFGASGSVPTFPQAGSSVLTFNFIHGPFPTGTYSCVICGGGEDSTGDGNGWNMLGAGEEIHDLRIDVGGNNNIFAYYTMNEMERSLYQLIRFGGFGSALSGASTNAAGMFFDDTESPNGQPGPARNVIRESTFTGDVGACSTCYGIAYEGSKYTIVFPSCTGANPPIAEVTTVSGGSITGMQVVYGGSVGGCAPGSSTTYTVYAAPSTYGASPISGSGTASENASQQVTGITAFPSGSSWPQPGFTGGPTIENVNLFSGSSVGQTITDGVWMQGVVNPNVGHLHCQGTSGYCEHYGESQPMGGGVFTTHDTLSNASGLVDLGPGIDNNQTFLTLASQSGNLVFDEKNGVTLSVAGYPNLAEYIPGNLLAGSAGTLQGPTFYGHFNNNAATTDNAGTCGLSAGTPHVCTYTFARPWNSAPVCTANDQTNAAVIKVSPSTSSVTFTGGTGSATSDVVADHCEGNPS